MGLFTGAVQGARLVLGEKRLETVRGRAIALHAAVIRGFVQLVGAEKRQAQQLVLLAKKNGKALGLLD